MKRDWKVFIASIFFVLGFSSIFSLVGVLLQSVLANVATTVQMWLGRIGGAIIILFGIYLLGLLSIPYLDREHKLHVKRKFSSMYVTSFIFGAAFAVGWTPCVGAVLGAILALAVTEPTAAFFFMLSYSLGLGIPFLLVGLFTNEAQKLIKKAGKWLQYFKYIFGVVLIALGVLVFSNQLSKVANLAFATSFLQSLNIAGVGIGSGLGLGISFLAGIISFLSPCVLPLIPAFLVYLSSVGVKK